MHLHEYLKLCNDYLMPNKSSQFEFMSDFFAAITCECAEDVDEENYYLFYSTKNKDKAKKIYSGERRLSKKDARFMKCNFYEDGLFELIDDMSPETQQNLMDKLTIQYGENVDYSTLNDVMKRLFLSAIEEGDIRPKEKKVIVSEPIKTKDKYDDSVIDEARRFSIKYHDQKQLLPLCQIAMYIKPMEPHCRKMYNDYICSEKMVREAIMYINDIPLFEFDEDWEYKYIELFDEDIKKLGISTFEVFYEGGKYFHRILRYADQKREVMEPYLFPRVPNHFLINSSYNSLLGYIDEFLYYKDDLEMHKYVAEPPLDYLWREASLASCPERDIVYWLNLFVYSACFILPREYGRKKAEEVEFHSPNLHEIETYEDLYYTALMCLYDIYK